MFHVVAVSQTFLNVLDINVKYCFHFSLSYVELRTVRKEFINAKYVDHKFARKTCSSAAAKMSELFEAVRSHDLLGLIQVYAEGVELMEPLPEGGQVSDSI